MLLLVPLKQKAAAPGGRTLTPRGGAVRRLLRGSARPNVARRQATVSPAEARVAWGVYAGEEIPHSRTLLRLSWTAGTSRRPSTFVSLAL